jgi:uncharacterized membrane protein YtjA (UPF0391 family)
MDTQRMKDVAAKALFTFFLVMLLVSLLAHRLFHPR